MAAIDTIEVLDGLQFQHLDTADIYSIDADKEAGEAVVTFPVVLPLDIAACRVIINNAYGNTALVAGGSQVHTRVKLHTATITAGVKARAEAQLLEWTAVAAGAMQESSESADISTSYSSTLQIDVAITGTTAHLGTEIRVQIRKEASVEEWTDWCRVVRLAGKTAMKSDVASTAAAGQNVIAVNNPVAGNLDHVGRAIFILDATVANCEICYQTACGADA